MSGACMLYRRGSSKLCDRSEDAYLVTADPWRVAMKGTEAPSGARRVRGGLATPPPSEGGGVEGSRGANFFRGVLRYLSK